MILHRRDSGPNTHQLRQSKFVMDTFISAPFGQIIIANPINVLQSFVEEVTSSLATNDDVVLRNFGAFQVTKTKPKIGRNPNKPDAAVPIPARAVVKFKPGKELKEKVAKVLPELETTD